jgi:hypothetical protein
MKDKPLRITSLKEVTDKFIGKIGTPNRDRFEYELQMDLIGLAIKQTNTEQNPSRIFSIFAPEVYMK